MGFGLENDLLLKLLNDSLAGDKNKAESGGQSVYMPIQKGSEVNWDKLLVTARQHSVLSLLYLVCEAENCNIPKPVQDAVQKAAVTATKQSYRLLFLSKFLVYRLWEAGISVVLLKGVATASFYPVSEYRKSGDVDLLLLDENKLEMCCRILLECGCIKKESQDALHHVTFMAEGGIEIELHTLLAEPFDNRKANRYLAKLVPRCAKQVQQKEIMGISLPILKDGYHAFELLLHMLQHFLRAGFGLKLLCDWVVFWNQEHSADECELYLKLVTESGMKGFSDMVTLVCCQYLGLNQGNMAWMGLDLNLDSEEFMREVLEAEEFGRSASDRMVVLRGSGLWDYVREFHHQMRLSFPKSGRCFLCWPILWIITFVRFVKNNRKVRNVSTKEVFYKASERSKIIQQMKLWKR